MQIFEIAADVKTISYDGNAFGKTSGGLPEKGQVWEGEVLFASKSHANIKLGNGTVIRAQLTDGVSLKTGETVRLAFRGSDGIKIVLGLEEGQGSGGKADGGEDFIRALSRLGIPATKENLQLAAAIKEGGFPFSAALMEQARLIAASNLEIGTAAAVFLAAHGLEPTPENAELVRALLQGELKIGSLLDAVLQTLKGQTNSAGTGPFPDGTMQEPSVAGREPRPNDAENPSLLGRQAVSRGEKESVDRTLQAGSLREGVNPREAAQTGALPERALWRESDVRGLERQIFLQTGDSLRGGQLRQALGLLPNLLAGLKEQARRGGWDGEASGTIDRTEGAIRLFHSLQAYAYAQIPILSGQTRETAQLYVFRRKRGIRKAKQDEMSVVLLLETAHMGLVEAAIRVRDGGISVSFRLEEEKAADLLRERAPRLGELLSACAFRLTDFRVRTGSETLTPFRALAVLNREEPEDTFRINIRV